MATFDVAVVGAGPAGSAAATTLAAAGRSVVLIDRAELGRDKCCGDGLTTGSLRRIEALGLAPEAVASLTPVADLAVRSPSGRVINLPLAPGKGLFAAVARRRDLDAALVRLACARGATARLGDAVTTLRRAAPGRELEIGLSSGATVRARAAIAADGAWSPVRRLTSPAERADTARTSEWYAFRAYASGVDGPGAQRLWVLFEPDLLPGYAWSFPLTGGVANIGVCVQRDPTTKGHGLAEAFNQLLELPFLVSLLGRGARLEAPVRAWPIPAGIARRSLHALDGAVLFAGDAAGAADPMTGEGIGQAIETGRLAAEAILAAHGDPAAAAQIYGAAVAAGLVREQRLSTLASAVLSRRGSARAALFASGSTPAVASAVGRWLFEDYPRTIATSPSRWREVRATRPGAYAGDRPTPQER